MDARLQEGLDALRRGGIVRVVSDREEELEADSPGTAGQFVLAAEKSTANTVSALLTAAGAVPVFVTTRDRLEYLQIGASPFTGDSEETARTIVDASPSADTAVLALRLALAAAGLSGTNAGLAQESLQGQMVHPVEWGGVANCPRTFEAAVDLCRLAGLVPAALVSSPLPDAAGRDVTHLPTVYIRQIVDHRRGQVARSLRRHGPRVRMPTRHGSFLLQAYEDTLTGKLHLALSTGQLSEPVLTRVHSECLTGDLLASLRCDCGQQLEGAMARLVQGGGVLLYMRQEGRGIGLVNKLRAYAIQDQGFDTVEANEQMGFAADLRDYHLAAEMLVDLGIQSIRLLTNNPQKVRGLRTHGIRVTDRVPLIMEPGPENQAYLDVKREKMGHIL